jgi:hypothetical protein
MNSCSNNFYDIQTMSTQSNKQCPNCKRWFTRLKSFKHHIRHCRRANCVEMFNDIGSTAANPLLSIVTPEVLTTVFQQSYLNQSDEDDYKETEQNDDYFASNFDLDSWENNDDELKEDTDNNS